MNDAILASAMPLQLSPVLPTKMLEGETTGGVRVSVGEGFGLCVQVIANAGRGWRPRYINVADPEKTVHCRASREWLEQGDTAWPRVTR